MRCLVLVREEAQFDVQAEEREQTRGNTRSPLGTDETECKQCKAGL